MIKSKFMAVGTMLLLLGQAHGATEVEVVNERMEEGKKQAYTVKALFQGSKSRYTFHFDEEDAETDSGSYLLSLDGGETAYYIDASDNSCNQWSNEKLVQTLSGFLLKTTDKFNVNTADVEVHKVFEKDVADMHDLPVKHIRINISFTASYKYMFFKDKYKN